MFITKNDQLEEFVSRAEKDGVLAVDTEFIREKTYYPKLCLLQLGTAEEQAAIDPFAITDITPLREVFSNPKIVKVFHSCSQDMEVLLRYCDVVPAPIFDTQIAHAYLSDKPQIGYGALVEQYCGVSLAKTESLTDWSKRPLDAAQLQYALDDVAYLPGIWGKMHERLESLGRLSWVEAEFESACIAQNYEIDPRDAFHRVKHASSLNRRQMSVLREIAAWRETKAQTIDRPRRWVMSDEVMVEIAKRSPTNASLLERIRGAADLNYADRAAVLRAVKSGLDVPEGECPEAERHLRPTQDQECVCDLMYALTRMVADREGLAQSVLASRDDLMLYLVDRDSSSIAHGWREEILGLALDELLDGKLGLTVKSGCVQVL